MNSATNTRPSLTAYLSSVGAFALVLWSTSAVVLVVAKLGGLL